MCPLKLHTPIALIRIHDGKAVLKPRRQIINRQYLLSIPRAFTPGFDATILLDLLHILLPRRHIEVIPRLLPLRHHPRLLPLPPLSCLFLRHRFPRRSTHLLLRRLLSPTRFI